MLPARMLLDLLKAPSLCMVCYGMYLVCDTFMENHLTTLDSTFFLKLMQENQGHSGRLTVYVRLCDPKMCLHTKFWIPRIYARDTIFLDLMAVVKMRDAR